MEVGMDCSEHNRDLIGCLRTSMFIPSQSLLVLFTKLLYGRRAKLGGCA